MKKLITICITLALVLALAPAAFADVDLSGMTFDELVALREQIDLAIWSSQEWQEVEVPQGLYIIGTDIPAGKWTIRAAPGGQTTAHVGKQLNEDGTDIKFASGSSQLIRSADWFAFDPVKDVQSWDVELKDGYYISFTYGPAVFTPYAGKPALGFK